MPIDHRPALARALVIVSMAALGASGCGTDVPEAADAGAEDASASVPAAGAAPTSTAPELTGTTTEPTGTSPAPTGRSTTAAWSERRLVAEVDAAFPHSEHRSVDCELCHQRPATHRTHTDMECVGCHARPAGFAMLPERSARECASCHHADPERSCRSCHESDDVGPRPVLATVAVAGGDLVRVRNLSFAHAVHSGRECQVCHEDPVTRHFDGDCASCHAEHHTPDAACASCHTDADVPVHTNAVHAGCAGGGCHGDAVVLALQPTRNVCMTCHTDLATHRPGRECTTCHVGFSESLGGAGGR